MPASKPKIVSVKQLQDLGRRDLIQLFERNRGMYHEWLRRLVTEGHRVDVLAEVVLGYKVCDHHLRIIRHQYRHQQCQTLVWRGAGKTTIATVTWAIWQLILNADRRILFASKTGTNAEDFLKEVKQHFESNERLREIFGDFVGNERWDAKAIQIKGRTKPFKEPSINTVGLEGAVASKHYDIIHADDLVDEENSRTKYQRDKMLDWYYKMLIPTLNPPTPTDRFVGCLHAVGTRYHFNDLYGHLSEGQPDGTGGEFKGDKTLVIPITNPDGTAVWPERFSEAKIKSLKSMGIIRFNSQYMCDCEAMKGKIFRYDDCRVVDDSEIPSELKVYMGVDLAISESEEADMFAMVCIGIDAVGAIYVLEYLEAQLRFPEQTEAIKAMAARRKPIRVGIEANAYQKAQIQQLKESSKKDLATAVNAVPLFTLKDKVTRAWNLAKHFENSRMRFRRDQQPLIEHLVLFPGHRYKDLFDALDLAVKASETRVRRGRETEPGLM